MRKLIAGIMEFRRLRRADYQDTFAELALGQRPDVLFIACSDSRVAVNVFASTDPGDMFVVRNVGNLIPPSDVDGRSTSDESEASAIEFALSRLEVSHVVVCGHSDCGAIKALCAGRGTIPEPNLRAWLRHAEPALAEARKKGTDDVRTVSQLNVLAAAGAYRRLPAGEVASGARRVAAARIVVRYPGCGRVLLRAVAGEVRADRRHGGRERVGATWSMKLPDCR